MENIDEILKKGVANIIPGKETLEKLLKSGKKLNIYLGIDPTSPRIHLGHAVALRKLQAFSKLGHNVTLVIGDFTALIGDTSDKESERPALTINQIEENFKTYKKQAEKILDFSKIKIKHNSEWLEKINFEELIKLCQQFSVGDFISRELIKKRLNNGKRVGLHEMLYPVMQGYDSYYLDIDIQLGGTDQTFNIQAGRTLIKLWRKKESYVLTTPILEGTDGRKMSKSWGNAIWLDDLPNDIFAKVMAINDDLIIQYYTLSTNLKLDEIEKIKKDLKDNKNPMQVKKDLAFKITEELCGKKEAENAKINFKKTVQNNDAPQEVKIISLPKSYTDHYDLFVKIGIRSSKSEIKRLIEQGGMVVDGINLKDEKFFKINNGSIIQVGKRLIFKIKY